VDLSSEFKTELPAGGGVFGPAPAVFAMMRRLLEIKGLKIEIFEDKTTVEARF